VAAVKVVIPAAGLGTRFLPVTHAVPKELLPLGRKPLIHHSLEEAELAGFDRAIIVVSADKPALRKYFMPDPALERLLRQRNDTDSAALLREAPELAGRLQLRFVEQRRPAGLGDAILACEELVRDEVFAVLLPDDVVFEAGHWQSLLSLHNETGAACFCVREVPFAEAHRFGIVQSRQDQGRLRVTGLVEKPVAGAAPSNLSIFGRYVITPPVLAALARLRRQKSGEELQLTDGFACVLDEHPVFAVQFTGQVFDCGTLDQYAQSLVRYAATHRNQ
jgi:UTP--glucose-1-phosphate uridylyltransferase